MPRMGWAGEFTSHCRRKRRPTRARLRALDEALEYVREMLEVSGDDTFLTLGEPLRAAPPRGADDEPASVLLRLPHQVAVDSGNGHVYQIQDGMAWLLDSVPALPAPALAAFPGHDDLVDRAMWAVAVHRDHVLPVNRSLDAALKAKLTAVAAG